MKHAVEHASSDLAATTKIPGFRKGKVPQKVLEARVGRDRIFSEAVESHIGGWFWNAAADASIRPVVAARAQLRAAHLGGPAVQLHRGSRSTALARGRRLERARGAGSRGGRARGARRARAGGPPRVGRRARPGRRPPREGRRRPHRRPRRPDGRGPARLRRPARRRPPRRGDRARPARNELGRDEEDHLHLSRGREEGSRSDAEGAQGARPAAARRRARPCSQRVRDARRAALRDRVEAARGDPGRARRRLSGRSRRQAGRGVEGRHLRRAGRGTSRRAARRDAPLARAPRPRRRDLPPRHGSDRRRAARNPARRGEARDRPRARPGGGRRPASRSRSRTTR